MQVCLNCKLEAGELSGVQEPLSSICESIGKMGTVASVSSI
jgi:hypothetical protein